MIHGPIAMGKWARRKGGNPSPVPPFRRVDLSLAENRRSSPMQAPISHITGQHKTDGELTDMSGAILGPGVRGNGYAERVEGESVMVNGADTQNEPVTVQQ